LRVGDNHCHLNPTRGIGVKAFAKRFKSSGGWFLGLVNLTSWSYGISARSVEDFDRVYRLTVKVGRELEEEGIRVAVILGPHPAELVHLVEMGVRIDKAIELMLKAYNLAASYVERGIASGLGEVGRPHWSTPRRIIEACNAVLDSVLALARELDCIIHIHAERGGLGTIEDLALRIGDFRKAVLHHAEGSYAYEAVKRGLIPSVPAKEREVARAIRGCRSFVVESDFLDDPRRPGAVIAPWSIASTTRKLLNENIISYEKAYKIHVDNIKEIYDIEP